MKIRSAIATAVAGVIGIGLVAPAAQAAPGDTAVTFTLSSGTLSIAVANAAVDLGTVTPNTASQISGDLTATTVTDNRNSLAGWTAYSYSTAFARTGGGATDIPAANVNVSVDPVAALTANLRGGALSPTDIGTIFTATPGGAAGNATHGASVNGGSIGALSGSSLSTLLGTLSGGLLGGTSNSTLTYTPKVTVTIPAGQIDGVYTGTVYQTVSCTRLYDPPIVRSLRRSIALLLLAGALVAPASRVYAQQQEAKDTGLGIRLLEAPVSERDDPRAKVYVIDHVAAGSSIERRVGIVNDTPNPMHTELYVAPAAIDDGTFIVGARDNKGELATWGSIEPASADLAPRQSSEVKLKIVVPQGTEDGEYYGGAVVEAPPQGTGNVQVAPRVAIRIYLSVGDGSTPASDFEVSTLTAQRAADGTPSVRASVHNTGDRALDMSGDLRLEDGPAGLSAGPFPADLGTTLGIDDTEPVRVVLDKDIPNGPWHATLTLRSGKIERTVDAAITFPEPGGDARVFEAKPVKGKTLWGLVALLLLLAALAGLLWFLWRRRRRKDEDDAPLDAARGVVAHRGPPRAARRYSRSRGPPLRRILLALVVAVAVATPVSRVAAQGASTEAHDIVFPVIGDVSYSDTFGAPRSGGRTHEGEDLLGTKMQQLVAAASGTIKNLVWPEGSYGNYLQIVADDGYVYSYVHINNDTPGTDDNKATRQYVYADGIENGARVERGQLVGYMGDSGNAESTSPHLHFEMHAPGGALMNPMASLGAAQHLDAPQGQTLEPSPIPRLAGVDRVATSVAVSQRGWPEGANHVVIASGALYAEALPASVLAARDGAPMLLVTGEHVPSTVGDELTRLHATAVTVIGSVAAAIDGELSQRGITVTRVGTAGDVVATSVAIAKSIGGGAGVAVLVNRDRFADGVSASALAAGRGRPILLTTTTLVPQPTVDAWRSLGVKRVVLIGGTGVIVQKIEDFVRTSGGCQTGAPGSTCEVERLAGPDRYATSVATTQRSLSAGGRDVARVLLGTGTAYPDSLASGPLAARLAAVALLVDGSGHLGDGASRGFLADNRASVHDVAIIGGSGAVTSAADRAIQEALGIG